MLQIRKYTAIKQLIWDYFHSVLSIYTKKKNYISILTKKNHLSKDRNKNKIIYITAIALQLSKYENLSAIEIANDLVSHFSIEFSEFFNPQILSSGWISLELADCVVAAWLQKLVILQGNGDKADIQKFSLSSSLFGVQYTHARCCSLIRLAQREGLIIPDAIPWLNKNQKLQLVHTGELHLVSELVQVVDDLECNPAAGAAKWQKAAISLSKAFEDFWCSCRIWGEIKATSPELAQARIGLVMVTQSILRLLLEEKLSIAAPVEL